MRTTVVLAFLLATWAAPARAAVDCGGVRCSVQEAVDLACPCATAASHGRHVRCVAHVVRQLVADGAVPRACRRELVRCAARSTCGRKAGAVVCEVPGARGNRCRISPSAEGCVARGGTVGTRASCCPDCVPPPPTSCVAWGCPPGEMCVVREPVGPARIESCEPVPAGCESDRTCACAGASLCNPPFDVCTDLPVLGGAIVCECPMCQ
jgi:hypothetical protein